jgi:DNA primase
MAPDHTRTEAKGTKAAHGQPPGAEDLQGIAERYLRSVHGGQDWQRLLAAVAPHISHGFTNAVLITGQRPGATMVHTYEEWKEKGRQVTKGEHGIRVVAEGAAGPARPAAVFDVSQTHPAQAKAAPVPSASPAGAPPAGRVADVLGHLAARLGFAVRYEDAASEAHTDWGASRIVLPPGLPGARAAAAIAHQLTHIILDGSLPRAAGTTTAGCHGVQAVEGDSAAYLVCARAGLDTSGITFPQVPSWAGSDPRANPEATIQAIGERIVSAAATIAGHIEKILAPLPPSPVTVPTPAQDQAPVQRPARTRPRVPAAAPPIVEAPAADPALVALNQAAAAFFRECLGGSWAGEYLAGRGIDGAAQRHWQVGYAPRGGAGLTAHLRKAGHEDATIMAAGLARRASSGEVIDVFRDRAVIPIYDHRGLIVGFIGRASPRASAQTPKYLNTRETALYTKGRVLFGLAQAEQHLAEGARPVIVEGPFDAIAVSLADRGRFAGVAPCGTALTPTQAAVLAQCADLPRSGVLVATDADTAGRKAAAAAYHLLHAVASDVDVAELPAGSDPAEILRGGGPAALARALHEGAHPLADVAVDAAIAPWAQRLKWAEGQIGALREVAALIARTPPADISRQVRRVSRRLGIPCEDVTTAFADAVTSGEPSPKAAAAPGEGPARAKPGDRTAAQVAAMDWPSPLAAVTPRRNGQASRATAGRPAAPARCRP